MDGLLIGEVATRTGVTRKAIRLYESRGIIPRARRTAAGYRSYPEDVLGVLAFAIQARRLGLTLSQIAQIAAQRRAGTAPCRHVRELLTRKAADLAATLAAVRAILRAWPQRHGDEAAVCAHIEANGGHVIWKGSLSLSARSAATVRKSSSRMTGSVSAKTRTQRSSRKTSGTSLST